MNQEENRNLELREDELEQVSGGETLVPYGSRCGNCGGGLEWYNDDTRVCTICGKRYSTGRGSVEPVKSNPIMH